MRMLISIDTCGRQSCERPLGMAYGEGTNDMPMTFVDIKSLPVGSVREQIGVRRNQFQGLYPATHGVIERSAVSYGTTTIQFRFSQQSANTFMFSHAATLYECIGLAQAETGLVDGTSANCG